MIFKEVSVIILMGFLYCPMDKAVWQLQMGAALY